jgi:hypothetical protein
MRLRIFLLGLSIVAADCFATRVKTGDEYFNYLQAVTDQSPARSTLAYYRQFKTLLPKEGRLGELTRPALLTSLSLAANFCDQLVAADAQQDEVARRWAHRNVNFSLDPTALLVPQTLRSLLGEYAKLFWQRSPSIEESSELERLLRELVASSESSRTETPIVLAAFCVAMGSSFQALVVE